MKPAGPPCNHFKPSDYAALVENERLWLELLMRFPRHRVQHPEGAEVGVIALILYDRTRWLRN
jgi:hypothetical protein